MAETVFSALQTNYIDAEELDRLDQLRRQQNEQQQGHQPGLPPGKPSKATPTNYIDAEELKALDTKQAAVLDRPGAQVPGNGVGRRVTVTNYLPTDEDRPATSPRSAQDRNLQSTTSTTPSDLNSTVNLEDSSDSDAESSKLSESPATNSTSPNTSSSSGVNRFDFALGRSPRSLRVSRGGAAAAVAPADRSASDDSISYIGTDESTTVSSSDFSLAESSTTSNLNESSMVYMGEEISPPQSVILTESMTYATAAYSHLNDKVFRELLETLSKHQLEKLFDALNTCVLPASTSPVPGALTRSSLLDPPPFVVNPSAFTRLRSAVEVESRIRQATGATKQWHEEFVKILAMQNDETKFSLLRNLGQDFVYTAETYGRIIISEMHLNPSQKTIRPVKIGGVAGGQFKYVCQGILFKFAVDSLLDVDRKFWMYGGTEPATEFAMVAAKNELRGSPPLLAFLLSILTRILFTAVISLYNCRMDQLRLPLMALIDFRGFRLVAQSLLPIDKRTIQYGSDDGGNTFHSNAQLDTLFKQVGEKLNLKSHAFYPFKASGPVEVCGPADIEGHIGHDGSFYVVDVARLMPPEFPPLACVLHRSFCSFLSNTDKIELVRRFPKALSSDACTPFGRMDKHIHNKEIEEATRLLQNEVIPQFAAKLTERSIRVTNCQQLIEDMHRHGINLRYLGTVRALVEGRRKSLLLLEMILRCLKNWLRTKLRRQMEKTRISIEAPYAKVILSVLNLVLYGRHRDKETAKNFWTVRIKEMIKNKFVTGLTAEELNPNFKLNSGLDMQVLLDRLQVQTGVKLIPSASAWRAGKGALLYTDIEMITTVTHHMQIVSYAEGSLLLLLSRRKKDRDERLRLLSLAENKLRVSKTAGSFAVVQLGNVYYQNSLVKLPVEFEDVVNAVKCYKQVIENPSASPDELENSLIKTMKLYYRSELSPSAPDPRLTLHAWDSFHSHVRQSVYLQKKLFRKKVSALAKGTDAIPADQYFLRQCVQYLDQLAKMNEKRASKFITTACRDQGHSLNWALQIAALSPFASALVIRQMDLFTVLDFKSQPELFVPDKDGSSALARVFSALLVEKVTGKSPTGSATSSPSVFGTKPRKEKSGRRALLTGSNDRHLLSATHSIFLKNCLPVSTQTISTLLRASPSLTQLQLDDCFQVTDDLALLLQAALGHAPIFLKRLSIKECRQISDKFFEVATSGPNLFNRLQMLNASGLSITNNALKLVAQSSPQLEEIKLNGCASISDLFELTWCTSLKHLEVSKTSITDASLKIFIAHPVFSSLLELDVSGCKVTDAAFSHLTKRVSMQKLNLSDTTVGGPTLDAITAHCPDLTDFNLGFQHVPRDSVVKIAESLPRLTRLKLVNIKEGINGTVLAMENRILPQNLQQLELPWCSIRELMIMGLHKSFKNLDTVDLTGCLEVNNHSLMSLRHLSVSLTSLNLSWCNQLVDMTLQQVLTECTKLVSLNVSHCVQLSVRSLNQISRGISHLDISACAFFDSLGEIPSRCLGLSNLSATTLSISGDQFKSLFSFGISLKYLNLKGCKYVDNRFILRVANYCPLLTFANLDQCYDLDDTSISELCCSCKYIQVLLLPGVFRVTDQAFVTATKLGGLRYLTELNVSGCRRVTDETIYALAESTHPLRVLNLSGCKEVSSKSFALLVDRCLSLSSVNLFGCQVDDSILPARIKRVNASGGNAPDNASSRASSPQLPPVLPDTVATNSPSRLDVKAKHHRPSFHHRHASASPSLERSTSGSHSPTSGSGSGETPDE